MSSHPTFASRDRGHDAARRKAKVCADDPSVRLFVESGDESVLKLRSFDF